METSTQSTTSTHLMDPEYVNNVQCVLTKTENQTGFEDDNNTINHLYYALPGAGLTDVNDFITMDYKLLKEHFNKDEVFHDKRERFLNHLDTNGEVVKVKGQSLILNTNEVEKVKGQSPIIPPWCRPHPPILTNYNGIHWSHSMDHGLRKEEMLAHSVFNLITY